MHKPVIVSTKLLPVALRDRIVQNGFGYVEYNAIRITPVEFEMPNPTDYVIFSSQNATKIVLENPHTLQQSKVLCVGKQSEKLLIEKSVKPLKATQNMAELVDFIEKLSENASFLHFCGNRRLPLLETKMNAWQRNFSEVMVYQTELNSKQLGSTADALLFFSPSGVESHEKSNSIHNSICFCIGNTTASAFTQNPKEVHIAEKPDAALLVAKAIQYLKTKQYA